MHDATVQPSARRPLPSGTVSFVFTDIDGSAARWEAHRDSMGAAVQRHDEILRTAIESHDGYVFKTVGDAFCAAFHSASEAVASALDAQRALNKEDFSAVDGLRVRMAIHAGNVDERDGDYFGPPVNRVARLMAIGYGGQVLVSGAAADLAMGELPAQSSLRDLGEHRLKDLAQPEQVYQLCAPDLPSKFFPLRSLEALPNNLPLQLTSFVGREGEIAKMKALLGKTRLLTLVGTGGVGKTRLSLQLGADLLDTYADGVWLAELAPLTDPQLVPNVVASALGVAENAQRSLSDAIVAALKPKDLLLIFDNCEHVVAEAAKLIDAVLRSCPKVRIIASSRQGLDLEGESVHRVDSLGVPETLGGLRSDDALQYGAVALFVERAQAANDKFHLTDADAESVVEICRRLDGIPLAIELAAARTQALSVEQLAARLDQRFRILTGGKRTALPRQQTMRALIDWSYDLLTEDERTVLRRVSVFAGGWTLDAASAVCGDEQIESWEVLDLLVSLVAKSLVVAELSDHEQRFRLLESTRQYALEKLAESGERDAVARKHAEYFLNSAQELEQSWHVTPTPQWLALAAPELDNFRAALDWAMSVAYDWEVGASLSGYLRPLWGELGFYAEGLRWCDRAQTQEERLSKPSAALVLRCRMDMLRGLQLWEKLRADGALARERYGELDDAVGIAIAESMMGTALSRLSAAEEGCVLLRRAVEQLRVLGKNRLANHALLSLGTNASFRAEADEARRDYHEVLATARAQGDERVVASTLTNLAECEFEAGQIEAAIELGKQSIERKLVRRDIVGLTNQYSNLAAYHIAKAQPDEAFHLARQALRYANDAQAQVYGAIIIQHLAAIAALEDDSARAARLLGYVDAALAALGWPREWTELYTYDLALNSLKERLGQEAVADLMAQGSTMNAEQAIDEALRRAPA